MTERLRRRLAVMMAWIILASLAAGMIDARPGGMRTVTTEHYVIHTDLPEPVAREAALRMSRMAEQYAARTRDFPGRVREKLPFHLYARVEDYHADGGTIGSAGQYDPNRRRLMAVASGPGGAFTWSTVQHEGFHQYAHAVIGSNLPIWLNEGLAEYFGEAVFTGDGFVAGVIPAQRLSRVRRAIRDDTFLPVAEFMSLTHAQWNDALLAEHYDQAWAMVQFLAHGDDGRYQSAFGGYIARVGRGVAHETAWRDAFGAAGGREGVRASIEQFERRWRAWWQTLDDDPTAERYAEALVTALAGVVARAEGAGLSFADFDTFASQSASGRLEMPDADWLPPSLVRSAGRRAMAYRDDAGATLRLVPHPRGPSSVRMTLADGTEVQAIATLSGRRVTAVRATIRPAP